MKKHNSLYRAIKYALPIALGSSLAMTAAPVHAQDDDEAAELDRIQVTGSRITRTDVEGALPVTVIDREAIEMSGENSIADLLRNTTFNSFGSFRPQSGSSAQNQGSISLRGLGSARTLVLIDGRRFPKNPFSGTGQDINSIPMGAVERIEILSDGASAVYGSDAIGGVINIITRKDYDGAQLSYTYTDPSRDGGKQRSGHAMIGTTSDRGRMLAVASKNSRSIIFANQRPWSESSVGDSHSTSDNLSIFGNTFVPFILDDDGAPIGLGEAMVAEGGCEELSENFYTMPDDVFFGGEGCFYDFTPVSADEASISNQSLHVTGDYEINRDWRVYTRMEGTRTESFGRYAPLPDTVDLQPDDASNPFDVPVRLYHRFDAMGPRDNQVDSDIYSGLLGFEGRLGQVDLDFGINYSRYSGKEVGRGYGMRSNMQSFMQDGSYDPLDPFGADDETIQGMSVTTSRVSEFEIQEVYASAGFDAFEMGAGPAQAVVGFEYREEDFSDQYDSLSEAGLVGGSAGNSSFGDRDVTALYTEWLFPVTDEFEITGALRFDDYSDYGSDLSPKIAFRYQPLDRLTLRGGYAEGYAAPDLTLINAEDAFSADFVTDFVRCEQQGVSQADCPQIQTNATAIGNPDLDSENSRQWSAGMAFEPTSWLNGSLDFYYIEIDDLIRSVSSQDLINLEFEGRTLPQGLVDAGLGVERDGVGNVVTITRGPANEGDLTTYGWDLNLRSQFDFGEAGRLGTNLQVGFVQHWELDSETDLEISEPRTVGTIGTPRFRANLENVYAWADFRFGWNMHFTSSTAEQSVINEEFTAAEKQGHVASWIKHDLSATYFAPWNAEITAGVRNVLDRDPPVSSFFSRSYAYDYTDGWGRIPYIRYTQNF